MNMLPLAIAPGVIPDDIVLPAADSRSIEQTETPVFDELLPPRNAPSSRRESPGFVDEEIDASPQPESTNTKTHPILLSEPIQKAEPDVFTETSREDANARESCDSLRKRGHAIPDDTLVAALMPAVDARMPTMDSSKEHGIPKPSASECPELPSAVPLTRPMAIDKHTFPAKFPPSDSQLDSPANTASFVTSARPQIVSTGSDVAASPKNSPVESTQLTEIPPPSPLPSAGKEVMTTSKPDIRTSASTLPREGMLLTSPPLELSSRDALPTPTTRSSTPDAHPIETLLEAGKNDPAISAKTSDPGAPRNRIEKKQMPINPDKHSFHGHSDFAGMPRAEKAENMKRPSPRDRILAARLPAVTATVSVSDFTPDTSVTPLQIRDEFPNNRKPILLDHDGESLRPSPFAAPPTETHIAHPPVRGSAPDVMPAMRLLHAAIDRITAQPQETSHLDLDLPMEDGESVRVRLEVREGEIKTTFRTAAPELRHALESGWSRLSQRWQEQGINLGDATFQGPAKSHPPSSQHQQQSPQDDSSRRALHESLGEAPLSPRSSQSHVSRDDTSSWPRTPTIRNPISLWA